MSIRPKIIGREEEKLVFKGILEASEAKFVAVYGRRRVGKTYLVKSYFEKNIGFEISGTKGSSVKDQLFNFTNQYNNFFSKPITKPDTWQEAFYLLQQAIQRKRTHQKIVLFFDELPWLAQPKSNFVNALDYFWNSFAQYQTNIVLIVCGSSASWILQKIVYNKGGLHNRITNIIRLLPFTLSETADFLKYRQVHLDRYSIVQLYMVLGGVPHYLKEIQVGESAVQAIDRICYAKNGLLRNEFDNLYTALFTNASIHIAVIKTLAKIKKGLTRKSIITKCKISNGGSVTRILDELEQSGFITKYLPFGKQERDTLYRLTDFFTLFYFHYMEHSKTLTKGTWQKLYTQPAWKAYSGYAFENICFLHTEQIKKALGIQGIYSESSTWISAGTATKNGAQIDLLIDRSDHVINILECKFSQAKYNFTKTEENMLRQKISVFAQETKTPKSIFVTLLTTYGLVQKQVAVLDNHFDLSIFLPNRII